MKESAALPEISEKLAIAAENSVIKKILKKITQKLFSFFEKKIKDFDKVGGIFFNSIIAGAGIKTIELLIFFVEKASVFPKWLYQKTLEKNFLFLGLLFAFITAINTLQQAVYQKLSQQNFFSTLLLFLASLILIFFGVAFKKYKKKSFFYKKIKSFLKQTSV